MRTKILMLTPGQGTVGAITSIKNIYKNIDTERFEVMIGTDTEGENTNQLRKEGFSVIVLNLKFGVALNIFLSSNKNLYSLRELIISFFEDIRILKKIVRNKKINIVHTHYHHHHLLSVFCTRKIKIIWHLRAFVNPKAFFGISFFIFNVLMYLFPDYIIAISNPLKNHFWKINQKKIIVIYNGVDFKKLQSIEVNDFFKRIGEIRYSHIIGTVGRYNETKGFHDFVKMAEIISNDYPEVLFVIIGPKNDPRELDYVKMIEDMVRESNLQEKILMLGFFEGPEKFMGALDILVHPNTTYEGFGNVILEAQVYGIPVITTDCGGPLDVVRENISGLIAKRNSPEDLAMKLEILLNNNSKYLLLKRNSNDPVFLQKFEISRTIKKLEALYTNSPCF